MPSSSVLPRARRARSALLLVTAALGSGCVAPPPPAPPAPEPAAAAPPSPPAPPSPSRMIEAPVLIPAPPEAVGMDPALGARLDSIVLAGIAAGAAPGASLAVGRYGRLVHLKGYGRLDSGPNAAPVDARSIYDLASMTKVVATATMAMMLEEQGKLQIDRPVAYYLPEFASSDSAKAAITVRMLLTHSGGLEAYAPLYLPSLGALRGRAAYLRAISERPLAYEPGTETVYSDWDMVLLQLILERISGETLDRFTARKIFIPLGMTDTMFRPDSSLFPRIAATAFDPARGGLLRGVVHDGNAWALGGVSGHAGLFSSARDLAIFAQMVLNGGRYNGVQIVRPETLARWTAPQKLGSSRALAWDTPSGRSSSGHYFSARSFGHTGYTGTSIWIDPERSLFVVLLTNRVNYGESNQLHAPLRRAVADAVQESILDAPLINWGARR